MGYKDLRFGKIVYILVFYNISFSWLLPLDGFQFFAPCLLRTVERENERDFFFLDKERPKLPFNSLSPSYCEVYSCLLLIYRSISKKIKSKKKKKERKLPRILNFFNYLHLLLLFVKVRMITRNSL